MADFNVRSDQVNVEQVMEQIRARIREKRGVDYTEQQIRELAAVKLEKFLDPRGVRSDLLEEFRRTQAASAPPTPPNYAFGEETLFETHRGPLRWLRRLLLPILKMFFNPGPLIQALHIQSDLNTINAQHEPARRGLELLHFEVLHNLVIETTRMGIELKNLKMRVESLTGRLEFTERRARALESVVAYRPSPEERVERVERVGRTPTLPVPATTAPAQSVVTRAAVPAEAPGPAGEGPGQRSRRRRRRRGRRSEGSAVSIMGAPPAGPGQAASIGSEASTGSEAVPAGSLEQAMAPETGRSEPLDPGPRSDEATPSPSSGHKPSTDPGHSDEQ